MEYSLDFAERLLESSQQLLTKLDEPESGRAVLYLSCLSMEVSFKSILENTGVNILELKKCGHNLSKLLNITSSCRLKTNNKPASSIRAVTLSESHSNTVGSVITKKTNDLSSYPNNIRYGDNIKHYPPSLMYKCAIVVHSWCVDNYNNLVID